MINFYLPGLGNEYYTIITIATLMKKHPEYFYDNIQIGAVYGSFPSMIWNGGRIVKGLKWSKERVERMFNSFKELNIPVRLTCTNSLIDNANLLYDDYCNLILDIGQTGKNEILVNSPLLEKYLRKTYPNYKFILSTTRCERDMDKINEICNNYDLVVIDYRDNKDQNFLDNLINKDKIEILVNAECSPECEFRKQHYYEMSLVNLGKTDKAMSCPYSNLDDKKETRLFDYSLNHNTKTVLTVDELYLDYVNNGFSNFKLEGRCRPLEYIQDSILYYMVRPEYKSAVKQAYATFL